MQVSLLIQCMVDPFRPHMAANMIRLNRSENVLEYVGPYTHRVAISYDRLISLKDGMVTFVNKNRETKKMQT